jgi:hypothetical protein
MRQLTSAVDGNFARQATLDTRLCGQQSFLGTEARRATVVEVAAIPLRILGGWSAMPTFETASPY